MRDDQIRTRLVEMNPWWGAAAASRDRLEWVAHDQVLRTRKSFDLGYRPALLDDVAHGPVDDKLVVVRGPRRVGKSVLLKDVAATLCARDDVDPRQIVYLPTDGMKEQDLNRAEIIGRDLTRSIGAAPRVWLFDEITSIAGWTKALKYRRDNTVFGNDTVVCTGSSWAADTAAVADLIAGRSGVSSISRLRILFPMSFREFVKATQRRITLPSAVWPWELQSAAVAEASEIAELEASDLDLAWQAYLESGGFPRAVHEFHTRGTVSTAFLADLGAWLHQDVDPDSAADSIALLLDELARNSTSPLNRSALAERLGYAGHQTLDTRLNRLTNSFGALWCHQIDDKGRRVAGSQSKLYLADPLLAHLPSRLRAGLARPDFTVLAEGALAVVLARAVEKSEPGRWLAQDTIGYLRTGSGNEVDFGPVSTRSAAGTHMTTPVESKWVAAGWRGEARVIEGKFGRGVVATRNIGDVTNPAWALPAPLVALLLG